MVKKVKPINAYAIIKKQIVKNGSHYSYDYKLSAYDIFVDCDVVVGKDEKMVKVKIEVI